MTALTVLPFEFTDAHTRAGASVFVVEVPAGMESKSELLAALASGAMFPGYFGHNWDALDECLRDFSWIEQKEIAIEHSDLPLANDEHCCRIYLEVLRDAALEWSRTQVEHSLRVVFPEQSRRRVERLLSVHI